MDGKGHGSLEWLISWDKRECVWQMFNTWNDVAFYEGLELLNGLSDKIKCNKLMMKSKFYEISNMRKSVNGYENRNWMEN